MAAIMKHCETRRVARGLPSLAATFLFLSVPFLVTGCQGLPRIDPSGERIFLPYPENSTQVTFDDLLHCHATPGPTSPFTGPAFVMPESPPPCLQNATIGGPTLPVGSGPAFPMIDDCAEGPPAVVTGNRGKARDLLHLPEKGERGRMMLSPRRVIAPVGGEVILLAGVCGNDGYLVTGEPIEWMLSPDSVGNIIQIGDDDRCVLYRLASRRNPSGKVDNEFARGRTSTKPALITRGTRSCNDDVTLKKGETWVSLSSPSEGVSHITALAPESDCWDHRKATTTIYWIDATWILPQPQSAPAGQPARLSTKVMRSEGTIPAEGWIVRYEILTPTLAGFAPDGRSVIEVPVNSQGEATVNVLPMPNTSGTAQIEVQVVRPAKDDMPRMTLTRGETSITWAAPKLQLRAAAPNVAGFDQPVTLVANISNPGDLPATDVVLEVQLPPGVNYVTSNVDNENIPGRVLWRIGQLPPRTMLDVTLTVRARAAFRASFNARGSNVSQTDAVVQVDIFTPMLKLSVVPTESRVTVGEEVTFNVDVENTGDRPLTNLRLQADGGTGFVHLQTGRPVTTRDRDEGPLAPGKRWEIGVTFRVMQPGEQCIQLTATADGGQQATEKACVLGLSAPVPTPSIAARVKAVPQANINDVTTITMNAVNNGRVPLTNVRIVATYDPRVAPLHATSGVDMSAMSRSQLIWVVPTLQPGMEAEVAAEVQIIGPIGESNWLMTVDSDQGAQARSDMTVRVLPALATPPAVQPPPVLPPAQPSPQIPGNILPNTPAQPSPVLPNNPGMGTNPGAGPVLPPTAANDGRGALRVLVTDLRTAAVVNENIPYLITIENASTIADDNVQVRVRHSAGMRYISLRRTTSGTIDTPMFPMDGVIDLPVVNYLRPGEKITYEIIFQSNLPQTAEVRVEASSRLAPNTITAIETTDVRPR